LREHKKTVVDVDLNTYHVYVHVTIQPWFRFVTYMAAVARRIFSSSPFRSSNEKKQHDTRLIFDDTYKAPDSAEPTKKRSATSTCSSSLQQPAQAENEFPPPLPLTTD
jgi:hypothetical protein